MFSYIKEFEPYSLFLISTALGMLVGLQREWADTKAAGIRTFTFVSLFGTSCALIADLYGTWFIGIGLGVVLMFAVMALHQNFHSESESRKSMVTGVTLVLMYIVGLLVQSDWILPAAALACLVAMVLHIKLELHAFADKVSSKELYSVMQFLLITVVILPLMPDRSFGPNNALNLYNIWLMVILIVGIGLIGYVINKLAGSRSGVIGAGIIGGIISSTATTLAYSRLSCRDQSSKISHGLIILIAWLIVYVRVFLEIFFVSPGIPILMPLLLITVATFVMILLSWKFHRTLREEVLVKNEPIDLMTAIFFAAFYSLFVAVFAYLKDDVSSMALYAVTFVAGILDIDAITLSTARLVNTGIIDSQKAVAYVFIALLANTIFKGLMCLVIGKLQLFRIILFPWIGSLFFQIFAIIWYW